ncbi:hypothetical protein BP6252_10580 [Coleophoma cylindrospora]|uniref:Guanine nucleotide exchange factor LTE1 n=1 Tax=Coleophoma cylindrospora TaxID=1849047 RepID=A0A3D8QSY6_9HELO|nr:hypothetical protein BP6252_10580 [Coleophoma cylindrospora]
MELASGIAADASMPVPASQSTLPHAVDAQNLRQRQRDRLSPRGRTPKSGRLASTVRETGSLAAKYAVKLSPAPRPKLAPANRSPDLSRTKQLSEGLRKESSVTTRVKRDGDDVKYDFVPDGGSAGREGRQFTVANVGNNGRIYLRPTVRPANQRYPQPSFVFPITPPSTAGLDVLVSQNDEKDSTPRGSLWTPTRSPASPAHHPPSQYFPEPSPAYPTRLRRAYSHSTIEESQLPVQDSDEGAFKIIIERPATGPATKDSESGGLPILEVPIPSWKLGTPRFSMRGTPFLRNSSHTHSDDVRSSIFSSRDQSPRLSRPPRILSRRHSDSSPQPYVVGTPSPLGSASPLLPPASIIRLSTSIVPEMYDALTFKPGCDHPSVVRYASNGCIKSATPARLVAEITSPTFVDYDLLSDFFLTYRNYLDSSDLLHMLIARLKWALMRKDEPGTVVRVRTFVAMRHWILNYFLDDFVIDYDLRVSFCELLNSLVEDLASDLTRSKVPLKVLDELKKCWRRVCSLYWDGYDFDTDFALEIPIAPGGIAGHRDPNLDPSFWEAHPDGPPRLEGIIEPDFVDPEPDSSTALPSRNFFADVSRAGHIDSVIASQDVPEVQEARQDGDEPPQSPGSIMSEDFVSCSFPTRFRAAVMPQPVGAHPVIPSSIYDSSAIATTPKALTGKRVRPTPAHKRSGSFSDSFRDQQPQSLHKVIYKSTEILMALPYAGSLVRGNLFPPGQAFVEEIAPGTPYDGNRATTLFPGTAADQKGPSAMSGPGMKKLLGTVRRALSTRTAPTQDTSPTHGSFPHTTPLGVRGQTIHRLPDTAIIPQARARNTGARAPMRIDLLGAEIAEDFKRAVREDAESEQERREASERLSAISKEQHIMEYSELHPETTIDSSKPGHSREPGSQLTNGSKSIVIVDDTLPLEVPRMKGALKTLNQSVDTFTDTFIQPSGGPTPPSTPPAAARGTPRRSSQALGRYRPLSFDNTPSLLNDPQDSPEAYTPSHRAFNRPSMPSRRSIGHRRSYSARINTSVSLRRYASFQSGMTRDHTERSFDATTFSGETSRLSGVPVVPRPLRVLRRRPGGDLRAVTNVGDLNTEPLRRPMSTGSLTTYSESIRSSFMMGGASNYVGAASGDYDDSRAPGQTFSLGQLAQSSPKPPASLFSTHSSQPIMRPSFEKEAQMLAQIPDDINDDGGVESALLKLEGKFEQRRSDASAPRPSQQSPMDTNSFGAPHFDTSTLSLGEDEEEGYRHRMKLVAETNTSTTAPMVNAYKPQTHTGQEELKPAVYRPTGMQTATVPVSTGSDGSYSSLPLLERGLSMDKKDRRRTRDWGSISGFEEPSIGRMTHQEHTPESSHPSYEFVKETDSMKRIPVGEANPAPERIRNSFDSYSDRSDLSSEMSLEVISRTEYTAENSNYSGFPPMRPGTVVKEMALPSHALGQPPSPPMTLVQALQLSPMTGHGPESQDYKVQPRINSPLTPDTTPVLPEGNFGEKGASAHSPDPMRMNRVIEAARKSSVHLPFTLAFDSQLLAQQFTLIEKDALNEIDWKDLTEMRWKDTQKESRSWVEFLRTSEPRGVEVVIARFNLMVKWAVSEIVLTQDIEERVRCIMKFIHIADHCRRYRNFATMTQLTVALTSKEIARLTETWSIIPAAELQTLDEMEALVTPTSNFNLLRAEMEGCGADQGCIPFVGIYTHDLLVNSERPSQIASTPITEPLVNFEKCRIDATIVKNLLRLLEASQLYRFLPVEGVTERCLWLAALNDEDIARYGKMIQA